MSVEPSKPAPENIHVTHGDVRKCIAGDHSECSESWMRKAAEEITDCTLGKIPVQGKSWVEIISAIISKHSPREHKRA